MRPRIAVPRQGGAVGGWSIQVSLWQPFCDWPIPKPTLGALDATLTSVTREVPPAPTVKLCQTDDRSWSLAGWRVISANSGFLQEAGGMLTTVLAVSGSMDRARTSSCFPLARSIAWAITLCLAAITVFALASAASSGQSAAVGRAPTFPARVEIIRLSLSVTDVRNRLITGLTEDEFAVFEDGIRQDLAYFTQDPLPLSVALLIDCSASMEEKLPVAQEAASRFIRTLRADDLGQVVQFNERSTVLQDFTANHDTLERAIRGTRAMGPTALYTSLYVSLKQLRSQGTPERPRRRAIVLLTDGEDTASIIDDDQVLELARRADVSVYAIGLRSERPQDRERQAFGQATYFLTTLTRDTGGQVVFTNSLSDLDAVYERIGDELRSQYTLGYVSRNDRRDGRWRRIVVRTRSREDLLVRHKLGYYAAKG